MLWPARYVQKLVIQVSVDCRVEADNKGDDAIVLFLLHNLILMANSFRHS